MLESNFTKLGRPRRGKVRDIYDLGGQLLLVATDRISAFDAVMPNGIPDKGKVLTAISALWLTRLTSVIPNHLITCDPDKYPPSCSLYAQELRGRSMLVRKTAPYKVECVVRGYLAGSGWKSYKQNGTVCGIKLPDGLVESAKLPEPIFTPATKAESGHDENISYKRMVEIVGSGVASILREASLKLYAQAQYLAEQAGIIIADTKFEFGLLDGEIILIDEVLTPDSSRFWPVDGYEPGGPQPSFDKQFVRDYLESTGWDKKPPAPELPPEIVKKTREKYLEAQQRLIKALA